MEETKLQIGKLFGFFTASQYLDVINITYFCSILIVFIFLASIKD